MPPSVPRHGAEQAVARQVAPHGVARDTARSATGCQQIGHGHTVLSQYTGAGVNVQSTLGVKQRACDSHRMVGPLQGPLEPTPSLRIGARLNDRHGALQDLGITADQCGQAGHIGRVLHGACLLCLYEIRKALRHAQQGIVEHIPDRAAGLGKYLHSGFRVALGLVMKALTVGVDLYATFHHQCPRNQRTLGHGPGTVALVGA